MGETKKTKNRRESLDNIKYSEKSKKEEPSLKKNKQKKKHILAQSLNLESNGLVKPKSKKVKPPNLEKGSKKKHKKNISTEGSSDDEWRVTSAPEMDIDSHLNGQTHHLIDDDRNQMTHSTSQDFPTNDSKEKKPRNQPPPIEKQSKRKKKPKKHGTKNSLGSKGSDDEEHPPISSPEWRHHTYGSTGDFEPRKSGQSFDTWRTTSALEMEVDKMEEYIYDDASNMIQHFKEAFEDIAKDVKKPNVLVAGSTGAGKSSLINTVFGLKLAEEGSGVPITQHFTKYEIENKGVVIYDSKGLEHGDEDEFITETNNFFEYHHAEQNGDCHDSIHAIWYIVNTAVARFQNFEEKICREVFDKAPIIFLLNKADISSQETRDNIRKVIEDMNLPHLLGIFDTIGGSNIKLLKTISTCPKCGSDDLTIRRKLKQAICEDCDHVENLELPNGLQSVIKKTTDALPTVAREAFISAQSISFDSKEEQSKSIIMEYYKAFKSVRSSNALTKLIAKMLIRLSILWEFKEHGHMYGSEIAKDLIREFSVRDKLYLFVNRQSCHKQHTTALGILWNRCLRDLSKNLFYECVNLNLNMSEDNLSQEWPLLMHRTFEDLNEEVLATIEDKVTTLGLATVLEQEMPTRD